jgi:hypothetical protein
LPYATCAVRLARSRSLTETALRSSCAPALPRPPQPAPTFVTMANAPLGGDRMATVLVLICPTAKAEYFSAKAANDIALSGKSVRRLFPSPLVGEGGFAKRRRVRGSLRGDSPLIRPRSREGTFSHKGNVQQGKALYKSNSWDFSVSIVSRTEALERCQEGCGAYPPRFASIIRPWEQAPPPATCAAGKAILFDRLCEAVEEFSADGVLSGEHGERVLSSVHLGSDPDGRTGAHRRSA